MKKKSHEYAVISLVFGIISVACVFLSIFAVIGIGFGIGAIILARKAIKCKADNERVASAGYVLGIIGLIIDLIVVVISIVVLIFFGSIFTNIFNSEIISDQVNEIQDIIDISNNTDNEDVNEFNKKFIDYEGVIDGTKVMSLITKVSISNSDNNHKASVSYENITEIDNVLNVIKYIESNNNYEISFDYDISGYISEIEIELED